MYSKRAFSRLGLAIALMATPFSVPAKPTNPLPLTQAGTPAADASVAAAAPALPPPVTATAPAPAATAAEVTEALPAPTAEAPSQPQAPAATAAETPASDFANAEQGDNAEKYCTNIADAAADARYARQTAALEALEKQIDERIKALEAKRAEYEQWLTRREDFLRKADESVVAIFTQMRPDAASQQMSVMDMGAAAAILVKLNPRIASAILNEMDPAKAAQMTSTMVGLAKPTDEGQTPG